MNKRDGGWILPQIVDPPRTCFTLEIPDEPMHRAALFGVLESLTYWWNWQRDDEHTAAAVTRVWRDVLERAYAVDINCDDGTLQVVNYCREYYPRAPFISFAPTSPFVDEPQVPPGWVSRPWYLPGSIPEGYIFDTLAIWSLDLLQFLDSYLPTDVLTFITSLPLTWLSLYEQTGLPRFEIQVEGEGEVEIHLLNVPFGSRVLITVDSPPYEIIDNLGQFLESLRDFRLSETDLDWFSLPPETAQVNIEEVSVEGAGEHTIYVTVFPVVDDAFSFIKFGVGLRKVVLCGDNIRPVFPAGREGEGEIIVTDPCGCESLESMVKRLLLGAVLGLDNQSVIDEIGIDEDGKVIDDGGKDITAPEVPVPEGYSDQQVSGGRAVRAANEFVAATNYIMTWANETDCFSGGLWAWSPACADYVENIASAVYDIDPEALQEFLVWVTSQDAYSPLYLPDDLAEYFFCVGIYPQAVARYAVFELTELDREFYIRASKVFNPGQYLYWGELGESQPINNTAVFPCHINEDAIIEIPNGTSWIAFADSTNPTIHHDPIWEGYPVPRSISIRAVGSMTFADGTVIDSFYRVAPDGTVSTVGPRYRYYGGSDLYPDPIPAYRSDHQYLWTVTIESKGSDLLQMWPDPGEPYESDASATGSFTYTFTDLGEA